MALAMGSIMAVEAVLLSHMDRREVVTIIPRMSLGTEWVRGRSGTGAQEVLRSELALRHQPTHLKDRKRRPREDEPVTEQV